METIKSKVGSLKQSTKLQAFSQTDQKKKKDTDDQNEKDVTTDHTEMKRIIKQYNEQVYANEVDIQMNWAHSLEKHK